MLSRRESCLNECAHVITVLDDIDLFIVDLFDDFLDADTLLSDTRTDWIDTVLGGLDRNLGTYSCLTSNGDDFNCTRCNFRNFTLKELGYQLLISSSDTD